jgi:hypothetical protein
MVSALPDRSRFADWFYRLVQIFHFTFTIERSFYEPQQENKSGWEEAMTKREISRRGVLKGSLMAGALAGTASYFGPWKENRVWAQGAAKPIKLGLTCDASGQYGNSGQDDLRGIQMAIDEANAKGGVLGRKVTWITADTETTPATGSRIAERRQRHHPGRRQERRDLPQHQFLGAQRGR